MNYRLSLTLESDLLAGSGKGWGSVIDSDFTFSPDGLPFIPGKRIKGLLKDALQELSVLDGYSDKKSEIETIIHTLFGEKGKDKPGKLIIPDLTLSINEQLSQWIQYAEQHQLLSKLEMVELFSSYRKQTSIGEDGTAQDHSLRTFRVLNRKSPWEKNQDLTFTGYFNLDDKDQPAATWLIKGAKWIKRMGTSRTRGLGKVKFVIEKTENKNTQLAQSKSLTTSKKETGKTWLHYSVYLQKPAILTAPQADANSVSTMTTISGASILGVLASEWIKKHSASSTQPHESQEFRDLFLDGKVTYHTAYPATLNSSSGTLPLLYQTDKHDLSKIVNIWDNKLKTRSIKAPGKISGNGLIETIPVTTGNRSHHERNAETGGPQKGVFFNYESVDAGQIFNGYLSGPAELLEKLSFPELFYLGRSRSSEYGECRLTVTEVKPPLTGDPGNLLIKADQGKWSSKIFLASDTIIYNNLGFSSTNCLDVERELRKIAEPFKVSVSVVLSIINSGTLESYVTIWNMKRPSEQIFKAGSSFEIQLAGSEQKNVIDFLTKLETEGIGERMHEGYGVVRLIPVLSSGAEIREIAQPGSPTPANLSKEVESLLLKQFSRKFRDLVVSKAVQDSAGTPVKKLSPSFLSRLILIGQPNGDTWSDFIKNLKELEKRQTTKEKFKTRVNGKLFIEHLETMTSNWVTDGNPVKWITDDPLWATWKEFKVPDLTDWKKKLLYQLQENQLENQKIYLKTFLYHLRKRVKQNEDSRKGAVK